MKERKILIKMSIVGILSLKCGLTYARIGTVRQYAEANTAELYFLEKIFWTSELGQLFSLKLSCNLAASYPD